jgi:type I thyroxine 5'-deiodinase
MQSNVRDQVLFRSPRDIGERLSVAGACVRKLNMKFPALIDGIDDKVEAAYTGWPDRLYLIEQGGRIAYKSKAGPFGFHPDALCGAARAASHQPGSEVDIFRRLRSKRAECGFRLAALTRVFSSFEHQGCANFEDDSL